VMDGRVVGRDCTALMIHVIYKGPAIPGGRQNLVTTTISHLSFRKP
jgi:hypothetical protein